MEQVIYEAPRKVKVAVDKEWAVETVMKKGLKREDFEQASTDQLAHLHEVARLFRRKKKKLGDPELLERAEQVYKESSLELFFRIHGDECRGEYKEWLEIKQKRQQEWEQQMLTKYGPEWREQVTDTDHQLLIFSASELEAQTRHTAIEGKAMQLRKREIKKLQRAEKREKKQEEINFFKLVKERTLLTYQFLGERGAQSSI